jgi:hypothetical protein
VGATQFDVEADLSCNESERWRIAGERLRRLAPHLWRRMLRATESATDLAAEVSGDWNIPVQ